MQPYHVYSDASARTRTAVAVCVISPNGDIHAAALPVEAKHIVAAEIRGCCLGLMMTPIGAEVVLHSDIDDLLSLYVDESRISYGAKFSSELTALRRLGK